MTDKSLSERLRDFENEGITSSDRYHLRNEAADALDAMLAALRMVAEDVRSGTFPTPIQNAINAAIAKAEGSKL